MANKTKVLVLVEGEKTDFKLMKKLFDVYQINDSHEIVSYKTNIYNLYMEMSDENSGPFDLLQLLKEKEPNIEEKKKFDINYSDIILIFDFDPQDTSYTAEKIKRMLKYFKESSDMGKLYINYPMVESFYHMKTIPDIDFYKYEIEYEKLKDYKKIVHEICSDYRKFAKCKDDVNIVIKNNYEKAKQIIDQNNYDDILLLQKQCTKLDQEKTIYVVCTCCFYILDYNPKLVFGS